MSKEARRPIVPEDLWALRRPGPPTASADGSVVVFPVTAYDLEANEGKTRLFRVLPGGGEPRPLTRDDASSAEPALSPDGTRLAFVRSVGENPGGGMRNAECGTSARASPRQTVTLIAVPHSALIRMTLL